MTLSPKHKKIVKVYLAVGAAWAVYSWFKYEDSHNAKDVAIELLAWPYDMFQVYTGKA
jgi:hypothetical protein